MFLDGGKKKNSFEIKYLHQHTKVDFKQHLSNMAGHL